MKAIVTRRIPELFAIIKTASTGCGRRGYKDGPAATAEFNNPGRHNWVTRNLRKATSALAALESGRAPPLLLSRVPRPPKLPRSIMPSKRGS